MIDFDYNATTPVKESVSEAMQPYLNGKYGNPSSLHQIGQATKAAVEQARETVAETLCANTESLVVTSSGSEANTFALRGSLEPPFEEKTLITTPIEHSSVLDTSKWLQNKGVDVKYAPVNRHGTVSVKWFRENLDSDVDMVSVMTVNNETGVILPVHEIAKLCDQRNVLFHTDAIQAFGKIPLDFRNTPVDMMSVSAHKIGGPKSVGALLAPKDLDLDPLIFGGHQERDRRGGTENVAGLVGFAEAARSIKSDRMRKTAEIRDEFENRLKQKLSDVHIVGESTDRVGNTSGLLIRGVKGEDVVMKMDLKGIGIATGAACTSGSPQPSHVIEAMPVPEDFNTDSFVRISLPPDPSTQDIQQLETRLIETVNELRSVEVEPV